MAGSSPGAASPSSSFSSLDPITDEREFDRLSSTIPDSQPSQVFFGKRPSPKRFSAAKDEISESTLSAGFSYGAKAPPRPGQFSERPKHQPAGPSAESSRLHEKSSVPPESWPSRPRPIEQALKSRGHRMGVPLDLSELGLPGIPQPRKPPPQHTVTDLNSCERLIPVSCEFPIEIHSSSSPSGSAQKSSASEEKQIRQPAKPPPSEGKNAAEIQDLSLPFIDTAPAPAPPFDTSSPSHADRVLRTVSSSMTKGRSESASCFQHESAFANISSQTIT